MSYCVESLEEKCICLSEFLLNRLFIIGLFHLFFDNLFCHVIPFLFSFFAITHISFGLAKPLVKHV